MTTDALLAAVRADPDADLPRLVYADALEDAGDAERAEFIRVQCELARLSEWDDRRSALEDREHELLDRHEAAWLGELPDELDEWEWRRGFVDEVSVADLSDPLAGFAERHPVTAITSRGPAVSAAFGWADTARQVSFDPQPNLTGAVALLAHGRLPHLRGLDTGTNRLNPGELAALGRSAVGRQLTELDVADHYLDRAALAEYLADAPLTRLGLPGACLSRPSLFRLIETFGRRLTTLDLSEARLPDGWQFGFDRMSAGAPLERLSVAAAVQGATFGVTDLGLLLERPGLARLTDLDASRGPGRVGRYLGLAYTGFWTRATCLRLHSCDLTAAAFRPLTERAGPPGLRLLDRADNRLGQIGVGSLVRALWGDTLTWLALSRNELTDAAVGELAGSGKFTALRTLHLSFDPLTDATAVALAMAGGLSRLRILTLNHTRLSDAAVPRLLDAPHWRLSGLGLAGCDLSAQAVHVLAGSPRLRRLQWLDLSDNPRLGGHTLMPLARSPHLCRLCELDLGRVAVDDRVRAALRERLGRRLSD